jgi:hypothetical protein
VSRGTGHADAGGYSSGSFWIVRIAMTAIATEIESAVSQLLYGSAPYDCDA